MRKRITKMRSGVADFGSRIKVDFDTLSIESGKNIDGSAANAEMQRELQKLRAEVSELTAEKLKIQTRFTMAANIDAAVAELFEEVCGRTASDPKFAANPILMLDLIRSEISTMLAFKDRYESAIRDPLKIKKEQQEQADLRLSLQKYQQLLLEAEKEKGNLREEIRVHQAEKNILNREKTEIKARFDTETAHLKVELETLEKESVAAKAHAQKSNQQKLKLLEEQVKEIQQDKEAMEKQLKQRISNLTIDNARAVSALEEKIAELQIENKNILLEQNNVNKDVVRTRLHTRESSPERTNSPVITKGHPQWGQLQKLRGQVFEYQKRIKQLKKDMEIMKSVKQPHATIGSSPNHAFIEVYKKTIKDKDREISQYQSKVSRLIGISQKAELMKKTAELAWLERDAVIDELSSLRKEINLTNGGKVFNEVRNWMETLPIVNRTDEDSSSDEDSKKRPKTAPTPKVRNKSKLPHSLLSVVTPS